MGGTASCAPSLASGHAGPLLPRKNRPAVPRRRRSPYIFSPVIAIPWIICREPKRYATIKGTTVTTAAVIK